MTALQILLIVIAIQYVINFIIAYITLPKHSTLNDWVCELQQFHWVVWFPILGFVLQIIMFVIEFTKALLRSLKKLRIK